MAKMKTKGTEGMAEVEVGAPAPQEMAAESRSICPTCESPDLSTMQVVVTGAATIVVPLGEIPGAGYLSRHVRVDANALTRPQATALQRLVAGLRKSNSELHNGKPIVTSADAIRWLLEQM